MTKNLVLVVDDEYDIRESVRLILEDEGFKIETAKDGEDCLKKLDKISPDVILLDILMPGLKTKDIVKGINEKNKKTQIIFLTAVKLSDALKQKIVPDNTSDYIEKPFCTDVLVRTIKGALVKS